MPPLTLSICIIAHNEEKNISRALESARFADEVIVVDCASTDATALIAEESGARVFSRPNLRNLNVNKNYSFNQSTCDFIFCLDADEAIPEPTAGSIQRLLENDPGKDAFFLPRRNYYFGRWLKHGGHYPDLQLRLFRRGKGRFPEHHVHEKLRVDGSVGKLPFHFDHFPYRTRKEAERKLQFYTEFEAEYLFSQGMHPNFLRSFQYLYGKPAMRFLRRHVIKLGFLDGRAGWEAIKMDMHNFRLSYSKLCFLAEEKNR
jgi:glycosyltransferase involved in cell wall biosynthesis